MSNWVPPRWMRRAIVDPLWIPLACALEVVLTCVILVGLIAWPLTPRRRVLRLAAFAALYVALDVWLLSAAFLWWIRSPIATRRRARWWGAAHCRLLQAALAALRRGAGRTIGYQVEFADDLPLPNADRPIIVLSRHAGPGDSFTLVEVLLRRLRRQPRVVLKAVLQWDPGLDVVLTRLSGCFIASQTGAGDDATAQLARHAASLEGRDALLLFPEGANWTPRRHRRAVVRLLRRGHRAAARRARDRPRVLPPRPDGTLTCLAARPDADVLVVAHAGLDTLTSASAVWQAVPVHDRPMRISWQLFEATAVPRERDAANEWLEQRWTEIDAWVSATQPPAHQTAGREAANRPRAQGRRLRDPSSDTRPR